MGKYQGKPVNEWHADLSYHRDMVENPLVPAWVFPNVPVRKFRWDFLWFRRVCLWWVASYHGSGGAGVHDREGLDPVLRDWILEEMDGMQDHGGGLHVPCAVSISATIWLRVTSAVIFGGLWILA